MSRDPAGSEELRVERSLRGRSGETQQPAKKSMNPWLASTRYEEAFPKCTLEPRPSARVVRSWIRECFRQSSHSGQVRTGPMRPLRESRSNSPPPRTLPSGCEPSFALTNDRALTAPNALTGALRRRRRARLVHGVIAQSGAGHCRVLRLHVRGGRHPGQTKSTRQCLPPGELTQCPSSSIANRGNVPTPVAALVSPDPPHPVTPTPRISAPGLSLESGSDVNER